MKVSRLKIAYGALNVTFFVSMLVIGLTVSQPPYDPWLDVTDDGYGGIDDIVATAEHFGASGDPTKNVNVTNWKDEYRVYIQSINISIKDHVGFGEVQFLFEGYSRMYVYLDVEDADIPAGFANITMPQICWIIGNPNYTMLTWDYMNIHVTSDGSSITADVPYNYQFYDLEIPWNSGCLQFRIDATMETGWVYFNVIVYLRHE